MALNSIELRDFRNYVNLKLDFEPIVTITKEWMTWGDSYELDIANPADEIIALAVVLTIDCVQEMQQNNN